MDNLNMTAPPIDVTQAAKQLYWRRRRRARHFVGLECMFGEAGWDILLDLFIARNEGRNVSVSSACIAADVPPTTALRWIAILEDRCAILKEPDPGDRRRTYLRISEPAYQDLHRYITDVVFGRTICPDKPTSSASASA